MEQEDWLILLFKWKFWGFEFCFYTVPVNFGFLDDTEMTLEMTPRKQKKKIDFGVLLDTVENNFFEAWYRFMGIEIIF